MLSKLGGGGCGTYSAAISHCVRGTHEVTVSENQNSILSVFSGCLGVEGIIFKKSKTSLIIKI